MRASPSADMAEETRQSPAPLFHSGAPVCFLHGLVHNLTFRTLFPTLSRCTKRKNHLPSAECPDDSKPFRGGAPMESLSVERLDHLGIIAAVIKDLGLIEMIDARLVPDAQEEITPGEAVAGMILNGLGFANRPLSLTPQFFANKPLALRLREGVGADRFNRCKLGRTLDEASAYGCAGLLSALALAGCHHAGMDGR